MNEILINILIILASCVGLGFGANYLVDSAAKIAHKFGVSDLVIGLTVVAFGSSAPEFAATISSAISGSADMAVANVIGSNIFNIGIILGICAMFATVKTTFDLVWRDGGGLVVITVLLLAFLWDLSLARWEGIVLFVILVSYLYILFKYKQCVSDEEISHKEATWLDGVILIGSLVAIAIGGKGLVHGAENLAYNLGMSKGLVGLTVVAAGTSVPELVISAIALIKKQHGMSAGNLIGSNIFNTLGVLGAAVAITPLNNIEPCAVHSVIALIVLTVFVVLFMRLSWNVDRKKGIMLIIISILIYSAIVLKSKSVEPVVDTDKQQYSSNHIDFVK